jgi:transposase-like protein
MGGRGYSPEFRRKVLDLIEAGRKVVDVARDLGISSQTIYNWRRQDRIDRGLEPGLSSGEHEELLAAKRRIAQLEAELKIARRAAELLKDVKPPKVRYTAIKIMAAEKLPIQSACRILDVSDRDSTRGVLGLRLSVRSVMHGSPISSPRSTRPPVRPTGAFACTLSSPWAEGSTSVVTRWSWSCGVPASEASWGDASVLASSAPMRSLWTWSTARSDVPSRISCGLPISPSIEHRRGGCTAASCSTSSRAASWAGRSTPRPQQG